MHFIRIKSTMKNENPHTTQQLRCVIVDDEEGTRETLVKILAKYCPWVEVVGEADSVESGVQGIAACKPDLVLLDIEIIGGTGFDVLDRIGEGCLGIVFITAHNKYRKEALRYPNSRFLVKPISIAALRNALPKPGSVNGASSSPDENGS